MNLRMSISLFLSMSTPEHNYNAALRLYGPPAMFARDLQLPAEPPNAMRETNQETLRRLSQDLTRITNNEHTAIDVYRLSYSHGEGTQSTWGYCLEAAIVEVTSEVLILFRNDETEGIERTLRWLPLSTLCTKKHAQAYYHVPYTGPSEEVAYEALQVFRDVFEHAAAKNWSYEKRLEFYHSFPFEEMDTKEDVMAFRPILFGCPAFTDFDYTFPEVD